MVYTLISATPSPYARKVRVTLAEKGIPFELKTEVPWDSTTETPKYNPLEKLPVLFDENGAAVYESHFILEWLEVVSIFRGEILFGHNTHSVPPQKHPETPLMPQYVDDRLFAKQVEVVTDGMCDALVLSLFETMRGPEKESKPWRERQMRKVEGGLKALATWVDQSKTDFIIGDSLTLADIAAGSVLGYMAVRWTDHPWRTTYPQLKSYWETLEARESFANTRPSPQVMKDAVV